MPKRSTSPTFGRGSVGTSAQFNGNFPMNGSSNSTQTKRPIVGTSTEWSHRGDGDTSFAHHMHQQELDLDQLDEQFNEHDQQLNHHFSSARSSAPPLMGEPMAPPIQQQQHTSHMPPKAPATGARRARPAKQATGKAKSPAMGSGGNDSRIKGPWTKEEDTLLMQLVKEYGPKKWSVIASFVPGRIGKQCRERWLNHLDASVNKTPWTTDEDNILMESQAKVGNRWCEIAKLLPGRPENAVKNRWNSLMNRRWSQKNDGDKKGGGKGGGRTAAREARSQQNNADPASLAAAAAAAAAVAESSKSRELMNKNEINDVRQLGRNVKQEQTQKNERGEINGEYQGIYDGAPHITEDPLDQAFDQFNMGPPPDLHGSGYEQHNRHNEGSYQHHQEGPHFELSDHSGSNVGISLEQGVSGAAGAQNDILIDSLMHAARVGTAGGRMSGTGNGNNNGGRGAGGIRSIEPLDPHLINNHEAWLTPHQRDGAPLFSPGGASTGGRFSTTPNGTQSHDRKGFFEFGLGSIDDMSSVEPIPFHAGQPHNGEFAPPSHPHTMQSQHHHQNNEIGHGFNPLESFDLTADSTMLKRLVQHGHAASGGQVPSISSAQHAAPDPQLYMSLTNLSLDEDAFKDIMDPSGSNTPRGPGGYNPHTASSSSNGFGLFSPSRISMGGSVNFNPGLGAAGRGSGGGSDHSASSPDGNVHSYSNAKVEDRGFVRPSRLDGLDDANYGNGSNLDHHHNNGSMGNNGLRNHFGNANQGGPGLTNCLSPAAHKLSEINGFFRDGKIDAERKSQMKSEVLRRSLNGHLGGRPLEDNDDDAALC